MTESFPVTGRLAGIDFGDVRIGIALTDIDRKFCTPSEVYTRRNERLDAVYFQELARGERLAGFVVGLPVHAHGAESQKSRAARQFAQWLTEITGVPATLFDERYSTVEAETLLREAGMKASQRKSRRDMLAAQVILAAFLESGPATESPKPLEDRK